MNMIDAIQYLQQCVDDPSRGLPDDIFYYISSTTPLINVDLMIKDSNNRIIFAWRDDKYSGTGWHIPGGIIRFKETIEDRIKQVALKEIGQEVEYDPDPIVIKQIIHKDRDKRGHFISLLFNCRISNDFEFDNSDLNISDPGFLMWHKGEPEQLLPCHHMYRKYL